MARLRRDNDRRSYRSKLSNSGTARLETLDFIGRLRTSFGVARGWVQVRDSGAFNLGSFRQNEVSVDDNKITIYDCALSPATKFFRAGT
jgi:hypothetical protein